MRLQGKGTIVTGESRGLGSAKRHSPFSTPMWLRISQVSTAWSDLI